jgi:hypothetical protein
MFNPKLYSPLRSVAQTRNRHASPDELSGTQAVLRRKRRSLCLVAIGTSARQEVDGDRSHVCVLLFLDVECWVSNLRTIVCVESLLGYRYTAISSTDQLTVLISCFQEW